MLRGFQKAELAKRLGTANPKGTRARRAVSGIASGT